MEVTAQSFSAIVDFAILLGRFLKVFTMPALKLLSSLLMSANTPFLIEKAEARPNLSPLYLIL